ncbi:MAG: O-acetyl-ADP-ribose deacetylase [Thermomicrobiales bacterium]
MNEDVPLDDGFVQVVRGDITRQRVDAIVNAANSSLIAGGGVDGAIHRVAGPELQEACRPLGGCAPGQAKMTPGFRLPCRFVIHTVGPVWSGGSAGEDGILRSCYRSSMRLAVQHGLASIAFPAIATGAYGFPEARAAQIALEELRSMADLSENLSDIRVVCLNATTFAAFENAMSHLLD